MSKALAPQEIDRALALLRAEADRTTVTAVARQIGYSRPAVSMVLAGTYRGRIDQVAAAVLAALDTVSCPADGADITAAACLETRTRPMPTSSPRALRRWRQCQRCPLNPPASTGGDDAVP